MPQPAGRPKITPKKVMVTLAAHHAEQLQQIAEDNDIKLATLCGNILERYAFEEQGVLASDILKNAVVDTVHKEMVSHNKRVRALLARTALESIATRQVARVNLQAHLKTNEADKYNEQAWAYAVHTLKNPSPAFKEAMNLLSENIAQDDPGLLLKVRESADGVSRAMESIEAQSQQIALLMENQQKLLEITETMGRRIRQLEEHIATADERAAETFLYALSKFDESGGSEKKQSSAVVETVANVLKKLRR